MMCGRDSRSTPVQARFHDPPAGRFGAGSPASQRQTLGGGSSHSSQQAPIPHVSCGRTAVGFLGGKGWAAWAWRATDTPSKKKAAEPAAGREPSCGVVDGVSPVPSPPCLQMTKAKAKKVACGAGGMTRIKSPVMAQLWPRSPVSSYPLPPAPARLTSTLTKCWSRSGLASNFGPAPASRCSQSALSSQCIVVSVPPAGRPLDGTSIMRVGVNVSVNVNVDDGVAVPETLSPLAETADCRLQTTDCVDVLCM